MLDGSPAVVTGVATGPASAIGILGAEVYDANRATMKALAYRANLATLRTADETQQTLVDVVS